MAAAPNHISIDTVYQRVLALANKEQRGYITPQDFNLFANQAQREIFEQYFYDVNLARKTQGNDTVYADVDDMLEEKLQVFDRVDDSSCTAAASGCTDPSAYTDAIGGGKVLPGEIYRVYKVLVGSKNAEILNTKDFSEAGTWSSGAYKETYLLRPNKDRPIANIRNHVIRCETNATSPPDPSAIYYFKTPSKVNWGYIVMNNQAMYNLNSSINFELHASEETQLVNKILRLAGISIKQMDIMQAGQGMDSVTTQQQPKI